MDHNKLCVQKILQEMGIPDHLIYLQETCLWVKKQQLEPDMEQRTGSKLEKEYIKAAYLHNWYEEYIMQNARLDEAQAEIKIARRNINNIRYADDTTLMAESEEELKSLLIRMREESEKAG